MPSVQTLLLALLLTWLVEWAVAAAVLLRSDTHLAYNTLLINAFTNPLANWAYWEWDSNFWEIEVVVFLVEIPLYRSLLGIPWKLAVIISLAGNGLSAACSFLF